MGETYGYVRVSSADQNEARQIILLQGADVPLNHIFVDHRSGKDFNRPAWKRMCRLLRSGDLLVISSLDRLGRNYAEMLDEWRRLVRRRRIDIRILDMPILDTTDRSRGLVGEFLAELVLQVLAFVAENERQMIRERQRQGIAAAKARGVQFGQSKRKMPPSFARQVRKVRKGELSIAKAAHRCKVPISTFRDRMKDVR